MGILFPVKAVLRIRGSLVLFDSKFCSSLSPLSARPYCRSPIRRKVWGKREVIPLRDQDGRHLGDLYLTLSCFRFDRDICSWHVTLNAYEQSEASSLKLRLIHHYFDHQDGFQVAPTPVIILYYPKPLPALGYYEAWFMYVRAIIWGPRLQGEGAWACTERVGGHDFKVGVVARKYGGLTYVKLVLGDSWERIPKKMELLLETDSSGVLRWGPLINSVTVDRLKDG